jgi:hypothetical protein
MIPQQGCGADYGFATVERDEFADKEYFANICGFLLVFYRLKNAVIGSKWHDAAFFGREVKRLDKVVGIRLGII